MSLANDLAYAAKHNRKAKLRKKITDVQVDEIRKLAAKRTLTHEQIAQQFGITRSWVSTLSKSR